jgi:hypothetical protein
MPEHNHYLLDSLLEKDNNKIENSIRLFALGRKKWLFHGSPSGAKAGATFYSLIETAKQIISNHTNIYVRC